jgi:hypothetical protein
MEAVLMTHATVLVAPSADDNCLTQVVDALRHRGVAVEAGVLEGHPALEQVLEACVERGAERIAVLPFLFHADEQVLSGIRRRVDWFHRDHPDVEFRVAPAVGFDPRLTEIAHDYIDQTVSGLDGDETVPLLTIEGFFPGPKVLSFADLQRIPEQIEDVGRLVPGRRGSAISVAALLRGAASGVDERDVVFHSADEGFFARVSLAMAVENGILVYRIGGHPLPERMGGPIRLFIPETDDKCANVKNVVRLEIVE